MVTSYSTIFCCLQIIPQRKKIIIISFFLSLIPGGKKKIIMVSILTLKKARRIDKRIPERCVPVWFYILRMDHSKNLFGPASEQISQFGIGSCCVKKHDGCRVP